MKGREGRTQRKKKSSLLGRVLNMKRVSARLFWSYIGVCLVLILLMSVVVNRLVSERMENQTVDYYRDINNQISRTMDSLIKNTYQNCYWTFNGVVVQNAMSGTFFQPEDYYEIRNILTDCVNTNSYIDSIYLINRAQGVVFTSEMYQFSMDEFYDMEAVEKAAEYGGQYFVPRRAVLNKIDGIQETGYLTMCYAKYDFSGNLIGAMVVNLDQEELADDLSVQEGNGENHILILDENGIVIFSDDTSQVNTSMSSTELYERIQISGNSEGNFTIGSGREKDLVVYQRSESLGMMFLGITAYSAIKESADAVQRQLVIISLLFLLGAVILSGIFTKNTYLPISRLLSEVKKKDKADEEKSYSEDENEFEYLSSVYQDLTSQLSSLYLYQNEWIGNERKEVLLKLLTGSYADEESCRKEFNRIRLETMTDEFAVAVVRLDAFQERLENNSTEDILLEKYAIGNIYSELLGSVYSEILENGVDFVTFVIFRNDAVLTQNRLADDAKQLVLNMEDFFHVSCSVGISGWRKKISELSDCYQEALTAVDYRMIKGRKSVTMYSEVEAQERNLGMYPYEEEESILGAVRNANSAKAKEALDDFIDKIEKYGIEEMKGYLRQFLMVLNRNCKLRDKGEGINYRLIHEKLENSDTLDEKKNLLWNCIAGQIEFKIDQRKNRNEDLVQHIVSYITENYADPMLTVEFLADYTQQSPNQFRKIFKDAFEMSPIDYLINYRIERAKGLLINTDKTAKEIAVAVGYENIRYFYALFKKKTGMTCNEYRSLNREEGKKQND